MLKTRLAVKGLSGLLSQGKEKKGKDGDAGSKPQPVRATHFDYITKPSSDGVRQERPRAPKQHHSQGPDYPRSRSNRSERHSREDRSDRHLREDRSDRHSREDRKYRHSTGEYRNGSPTMHHSRSDGYRHSSGEHRNGSSSMHQRRPEGSRHPRPESSHYPPGQYRNGSPSSHRSRPEVQRSYSREDDEELLRINSQRPKFDERGQKKGGSLPLYYSQDRRQIRGSVPGQYHDSSPTSAPRGPPKPPRRQESLNRVHIPEGPDTDFTSASDYDVYSPSSGSSSPKNWKVSPLLHQKAHSPTREYARSQPERLRSPDRRPGQYDVTDGYQRQRGSSPEKYNWQYSGSLPTSKRGYEMESKGLQASQYAPREENGHRHVHRTDSYEEDPYKKRPSTQQDYQQRPYQEYWQEEPTSHSYKQTWEAQVKKANENLASSARPLVIPQNERGKEGPRPIYRSDGEIDLRTPSSQSLQAPDTGVPKPAEMQRFQMSSWGQNTTEDARYYPEIYAKTEPSDMQWEETKTQANQGALRQTSSLRTVRGVKAYDQHLKKFKRPVSLGGMPKQQHPHLQQQQQQHPHLQQQQQQQESAPPPQRRPHSTMDYPLSDDGLYPTFDHSENSAFGVATPHQRNYDEVENIHLQNMAMSTSKQYQQPPAVHDVNHNQGAYPKEEQYGYSHVKESLYEYRNDSARIPPDWPKDYPPEMRVNPPVPQPDAAINSVKQVDSGKQTIFCLVSQVVPTSPSPETTAGPLQHEVVEIENGKVSPVMTQPVKFSKAGSSQHAKQSSQSGQTQYGRYSPVRSPVTYELNQFEPQWKSHVQPKEVKHGHSRSLSEDRSSGKHSEVGPYREQAAKSYGKSSASTNAKPVMQMRVLPSWNDKRDARGASVSSGYHSSPENDIGEAESRKVKKQLYMAERSSHDVRRFSDSEYRFDGADDQAAVDDAPTAPVRDLIKKINTKVDTSGGIEQVVAGKRPPGDLKSFLLKDVEQARVCPNDETHYDHAPNYSGRPVSARMSQTYEPRKDISGPSQYYNEQYVTATRTASNLNAAPRKKDKSRDRPYSLELPAKQSIVNENQQEPVRSDDEQDDKPINAKERRAYFESLKPLSREEEIERVATSKEVKKEEGVQRGSERQQVKAVITQPDAVYGSIKWPDRYTIPEPDISKQNVGKSFSEMQKPTVTESSSPIRSRHDAYMGEVQQKANERQEYYERLRQRGQPWGQERGTKGRRSQSLPRFDSRKQREDDPVKSEDDCSDSHGPTRTTELQEGYDKRRSIGAMLFQQKKLEMDRHDKKQEILEKVKKELRLRKSGSEPDLTAKKEKGDVLDSLEQNKHFLSTHIAGKRIRGRDSADFEHALNKLQHIHDKADQDADEALLPQSYRPYDHRAAEVPHLAQRVAQLQELLGGHAPGSGKHHQEIQQPTAEGANADTPRSGRKNQNFSPFRQASPITKSSSKEAFKPPHGHESTSEDEKTPRPMPVGTNPKLYRHPKSSDNLGYSSDSSAGPERPQPIKIKPKSVVPEHSSSARQGLSVAKTCSQLEERKAGREVIQIGSTGQSTRTARRDPERTAHPHPCQTTSHPNIRSATHGEVPKLKKALLTKPPPAPALAKVKEAHHLLLQPPGSRDSVSTVDSTGIARTFDDMVYEYQDMMMEHQAVDMTSPNDHERSSSIESLLQITSNSPVRAAVPAAAVNPGATFSPGGNIPLADEDACSSSSSEAPGDLAGKPKTCPLVEIADL